MDGSNGIAADLLRSIVERIERVNSERDDLATDLRDIYAEAKSQGLDPKIIRQVVSFRRKDASERQENATLLDLYLHALGEVA